jgi:hypothetical protein
MPDGEPIYVSILNIDKLLTLLLMFPFLNAALSTAKGPKG